MATRPRRPAHAQSEPAPEAVKKKRSAKEPPPPQTTFFLRTKLLPPRPAPELLSRPRLTERLLSNLAHPVTLVAANAGSGKTTLVADFVRTHARSFVWYQLDHTDADPFVFLGYVAHGLRQAVPGFGEVTFSYLQQAADELARQPERAVDVLLNEVLEKVEQQLILVLDDYHHLGAETAVHRVVDRLLAYLPDVLHVIIVSRDVPPLSLARLRSHSSLAIIDRNELLFNDQETQELFRQVFDLELTTEQLTEYRERTHGWITALQLVRQVAQRQAFDTGSKPQDEANAPDLVEILRQSERDIFDYFAEEVFADEPEDVQRLLLRISLLDRVEAGICARLYPEANCRVVLPALVRRNVFMTVASDERGEEYRLQPLFRSFLRRRFRTEVGRKGTAVEHRRFADDYLANGALEQALRHLLEAEDFDRAAKIISEQGAKWIETGALGSLVTFAEAIPRQMLEAYPRALAYRAEVARLRGEYETAAASFRRAANLLHERGDREGEAEALHSLATIARRRGDCTNAFTYLDRAVELTADNSPVRIKCGNTRGLCLTATGEWTAAEREFRAALQAAEEQADERYTRLIAHNLGLPAMIRGDFGEALRWLKHMLREGRADAPPMPQEATGHLNIARCYFYRGDLDACERHLEQALERCQLFNLIAARAETFEFYGNLYRERADAAHATEFYERAARAYEEAGIDFQGRSELLEEQALLKLQLGDLSGARTLLDRLVSLRAEPENEMGRYTATLSRGRVRLAQGEHEAARDELLPAFNYFRQHGLYYYEAQAGMGLAACEAALGREGEMIEHLQRTLDLAARYDYDYWLRREVAHHPQLFAQAEAAELLPADVRDEFIAELPQSAAAPPAPVAAVATQPVTDLTINMLGPIEILRDPSRPLSADAWTTKRARDILCFIVSRRHRRASKDAIIDTFWGEADFEAVEKNFHPTVSHIRKALNSNQPLKQNFLLYRDGDYQLNADFSYRIDIEEFDRLVSEGEAARRAGQHERCLQAYETAVALYRGEFMQGSYDEWVEEQRSYYSEQYLRMLEALAVAAQKAEEWPRSLRLAQQILKSDPFREDVHCMLMRAHAGQGNRVAVKEQYESLRRLLRKELGVEPAPETQKIYRDLVK